MKIKYTFSSILFSLFIISLVFFISINTERVFNIPNSIYQVYLDGEILGVVESKDKLIKMINDEQSDIKEKYGVDQVHVPNGLEIKNVVTYDGRLDTIKEVYDKITKLKQFTVEGYEIRIIDESSKVKDKVLYVLDKTNFEKAVKNVALAFIDEKVYNNYLENKQEPIVDVGTYIENIEIGQEVAIKPAYISVDKQIFQDENELTRYLLFGTLEAQKIYKIKSGDTIEKVAEKNKLSVDEFIIANPDLKSKDVLLFAGQQVNIALIKPLLDIVVVSERTEIQSVNYTTKIKYDYNVSPYTNYVQQKGVKGKSKVTFKVETVNGQDTNVVKTNTVVLSAPVQKVVIRGYGVGGGYIYTDSEWGWPTNAGYSITSNFGYRWGSFHRAIDIAGTGYGSPIYAVHDGYVYDAGYVASDMGYYVCIDHRNGYYTRYMHMTHTAVSAGTVVKKGQKIGGMGNTGYVVPAPTKKNPFAGTHLHFEVWKGGKPWQGGTAIDPLKLYK